ncbi:MAG: glycosyltransferase [Alphaproteobacteria bacterium]|nr:glycosyltransferase [Alphaproteobacteria bacterium]NNF24946.1 glycosyltransferase family 2 protein [Paracoccaceae bacterium]
MAQQQDPQYAVIIPHYNDVDRLRRCLHALAPQAGADVEIVVADNNSSVDLARVKAEFPRVRFVVQTEKGAGPARNLGVAQSSAPWLLFIDADCVAAPDWVETARRIGREDAVIGGRVDVFDETPPPRSGAEAFEAVFAFKMEAYFRDKKFLGSGNLVTSRAVFDKTGGFRSGVSEDVEWSQRAASTGFQLGYDNDFAVGHPSRPDWPALSGKWRRLVAENFLLEGKSPKARARRSLRALAMPLSAIAHIPKVIAHADLAGREKARAILTLFRLRLARMGWMLRQVVTGKP